MRKSILMLGIFVVFSLSGCTTYVKPPPPPLKVEARPIRPHRRAVWVTGHWAWRGRRVGYVWIPGHWKAR